MPEEHEHSRAPSDTSTLEPPRPPEPEAALARAEGASGPQPPPRQLITPQFTPVVDALPASKAERFRRVSFLGEGGMGRVWLAFDTQLQREVALKFVRTDNPELARRIVREGRAQARVNHERVCKVYDVSEEDGCTFIAMQYVAGQPLGKLTEALNVEQKALIMREVALGVHEAHRVGLIHRDIKPSNIMVERTADGSLKPYVMDFGLARQSNENTTLTGTVLGTPQYMSPEQARGEIGRLDRRADVYSLGATLYHLLTGSAPISGSNTLEVLANIPAEEPPPPRKLNPDIPQDLSAITLRCLEKDRSGRYDSARALAEDLDRFLLGEPILARAGLWYRLRRRARKHRAVISMGVAASLLVSATIASMLFRTDVIRSVTVLVEAARSSARISGLAPLHDTGEERKAMRRDLAELDALSQKGGDLVAGGALQYARGRILLALDEPAEALEALERAWARGYREPEVADALVEALASEYRKELARTRAVWIQDEDRRQASLPGVRNRYEPRLLEYLEYLRSSKEADMPPARYREAQIAHYEGRHDDARALLDVIGKALPEYHEPHQLRGDIHVALFHDCAENQQCRQEQFLDARKAYERAAEIGRSVPSVYRALARLELLALVEGLYAGKDVRAHFDAGLAALDLALKAAPESAESLVLRSQFHRRLAQYDVDHGGEGGPGGVEDLLALAQESAEKARSLAPASTDARLELAQVCWLLGYFQERNGRDPGEALRRAEELLDSIETEQRDRDYYIVRGLVYRTLAAAYDRQNPGKPSSDWEKAIADAQRSITFNERLPGAWAKLGMVYHDRAMAPGSVDPDGDLARAREMLEKALSLAPPAGEVFSELGKVWRQTARRAARRGEDPRPVLSMALSQYRKGLEIDPQLLALHNGIGLVHFDLAEDAWNRGADPVPSLLEAEASFQNGLKRAPKNPALGQNVAEAAGRVAIFLFLRGEDPSGWMQTAIRRYRDAAALAPESCGPEAQLGWTLAILGKLEMERGRDPGPHLADANTAAGKARRMCPRNEQAWRALASSRGSQALWDARRGASGGNDFEEVTELHEQGLELVPGSQDLRAEYAEFSLAWAEQGQGSQEEVTLALQRARRLADELLSARPGWPKARALRGWALGLEAMRAPSEDRGRLQQALDEIDTALRANPNISARWRNQREKLERRLAGGAR